MAENETIENETDDGAQNVEILEAALGGYVKVTDALGRIDAVIKERRDEMEAKLADWVEAVHEGDLLFLGAKRDKLERDIFEAAAGKEYRPDAGFASVVVKKGRRTWGKNIDITALESPGMEGVFGPPSNWLVEVPACFKQRSMADVDRTAETLGLNDEARRLLFTHLDLRGGEERLEIQVDLMAMAVEKALAGEKGGA